MEELEKAYEDATKEDMERFEKEVMAKYDNFTATFDDLRKSYNDQTNNLAVSLQEKMLD